MGALLLANGDNARLLLRYDRAALAHGEWWRLLTAHWVHGDTRHFALNAMGLVLVWALVAKDFNARQWIMICAGSSIAIGLGLWWLDARVEWYLGASGVLHAALAAGTTQRFFTHAWDRWLLATALAAKLLLEQTAQRHGIPDVVGNLPVVVDAHLYGALSGAFIAAMLCANAAILRATRNS